MFMRDYLAQLNDAQHKAVTFDGQALKVVAGAGTGKTRVITRRIAYLLDKKGVRAENILAITFTNKAAAEMVERVAKLTDTDQPVTIKTFHAFGVQILRRYGEKAGVDPDFLILDAAQSRQILKDLLPELGFDPTQWKPKTIYNFIANKKSDGIGAENFSTTKQVGTEAVVAQIWPHYKRELADQHALDFADLILKPYQLLRDNQAVRNEIQHRYSHILVDEYQDTSRLQSKLVQLLVGDGHIFVVGDGDQTIYSWRGASVENILSFEDDFPEAETVTLDTNYRSRGNILSAANSVISQNDNRDEKTLKPAGPDGDKLKLIKAFNERAEAQKLVEHLRRWHRDGGDYRDWTVLYRTNFQSRILEETLNKAGIPYSIAGTGFLERKEVRDVLAYIRFALNREATVDLKRIINRPRRGIGKKTQQLVIENRLDEASPTRQKKVESFYNLCDKIEALADELPPSQLVETVFEISGLKSKLEDDHETERLENVAELVSVAAEYDDGYDSNTEAVKEFLSGTTLSSDQDEVGGDGVRLMTVHAAKGLEFPRVWIVGLEDELFPHKISDDPSAQEEERRLFYVALTRAQQRVVLSFASSRRVFGTRKNRQPSPFITDIDDHLLDSGDEQESPDDGDVVFFD